MASDPLEPESYGTWTEKGALAYESTRDLPVEAFDVETRALVRASARSRGTRATTRCGHA